MSDHESAGAGLDVELLRQALANTMHQLNPAGDAPSLVWSDGSPLTPEDAGRAFVAAAAAEYARLVAHLAARLPAAEGNEK